MRLQGSFAGLYFGGLFCACAVLSGCLKISQDKQHLSFKDRRAETNSKLFGKDIILFSSGVERSSFVTSSSSRSSFQKTVQSLSFLGLKDVDIKRGVIETDWYAIETPPMHRIKVRVSGLKEEENRDIHSPQVNIVILTQIRNQKGWQFVATPESLRQNLISKLERCDESNFL